MCRCHAITGTSHSLDVCKAGKTSCLNKPLMFYRSQLISTPLGGSRCVQDEHCGDIWPKSTPCTGDPIRGRKARMINGHNHRSFSEICLIRSCFMFMYPSFFFSGSWSVPLKMANSLFGTVILQTRQVLFVF